jgi:hypothetical protein
MMRWFGPSGRCPPMYVRDLQRVRTPVALGCNWCYELIDEDDFGLLVTGLVGPELLVAEFPYHHECQARQMIGSLTHLRQECSCFIPDSVCTDPPEMTRREAARAALAFFQKPFFQKRGV